VIGLARIHAAFRQPIERSNGLNHPRVRERNSPPSREINLRLALPINNSIEPKIECNQWRANEKNAGGDRKKISARESARN
jgi:hypothetical protein